jgi:hypothetical protein
VRGAATLATVLSLQVAKALALGDAQAVRVIARRLWEKERKTNICGSGRVGERNTVRSTLQEERKSYNRSAKYPCQVNIMFVGFKYPTIEHD